MSFTTIAYCQQLADWEWKVYYDIVEKWHELLYEYYYAFDVPQSEFDNMYSQIGNEQGVSSEEVKRIDNEGILREPTDREYDILDELYDRLDTLSENSYKADAERIHDEVAEDYGIGLSQLYEIEYRIEEGFWFF